MLEAKKVRAGAHTRDFDAALLPEQMRATAEVLNNSPVALSLEALAQHFAGRGPWKKRLPQILDTLEALGRARKAPADQEAAWTRA